jgi:5-methylcytosine-specific restriction endonuclease McrA
MKIKRLNRSKIIKKLVDIAKTQAKIRDNYTCQKCGKKVEGSNAHGSHVIPVSAGNKLKWDIQNIKTLCYHCHINWWHKNPIESGEWFKAKFPKRWKYLEENKGIKIFKTFELKTLLQQMEER